MSGDLDFDATTPVCDVPLDDDSAVITADWYGPEIALGLADSDARGRKLVACALAAVALLAGCGGGKHHAARTASAPMPTAAVTANMRQTVWLYWAPVAGASGYQLTRDGVIVSTAGATATSARFTVTAGVHTIAATAVIPAPPPPTTTVATTTASTTTAPPSSGCRPDTVACGYPGPGVNDGVPPGTTLQTGLPPGAVANGGELDVNTPGTIIDGYHLTRRLQINAAGVVLKRSLIEVPGVSGQTGVAAIGVTAGLAGVNVSDVECRSSNAVAIEACLVTGANVDVTVARPYFHGCADCIETYGHVTVDGGWIASDAMQPGDHVEPVYVSGPAGDVVVTHSVLYNPFTQTALLFVDNFTGQATASFSGSLGDGGGWAFYSHVTLTDDRLARCLAAAVPAAAVPAAGGGHACTGGPDAHGSWPFGGFFGPFTPCPPLNATNVVWDDTGAPVTCPAGTRAFTAPLHAGRPRGADLLLAELSR